MKVYNNLIPKELRDITRKVIPIKRTDSDHPYLDDSNAHEYLLEENDEEILTYNHKGKLVHIKRKK